MNRWEFVEKVKDEYEFAKSKGFESINIIAETEDQDYEISEYEDGFINDGLNGVYTDIEEIAEAVFNLIDLNEDNVTGFRIE
jgi:hypothetical protein